MFTTRMEYLKYFLCILVWSVVLLDENMLSFMLKTYQGDIYNNMFALMLSGVAASYLAFYLVGKFEPALALAMGFMIMMIASGFIYPFMGSLSSLLPGIASVEHTAMGVLIFAKLGAGSAHHLAYLFVIWQFNAR
jgi:hypothetical protein